VTNITNFDNDFGFFAISEEEMEKREQEAAELAAQAAATAVKEEFEQEVNKTAAYYNEKLQDLYSAVMPLLVNLSKDSEKTYLYWPNRAEKMQIFINKVNELVGEDISA
jgi:endoglucanase Acf2